MDDHHEEESIPVPRSRVFVMRDGSFVVQWEENRVQQLLTGRYNTYTPDEFGTQISDYELTQLQNSGIVDHYDRELVFLSSESNIMTQAPTRSYYLNTTLSKDKQGFVEAALRESGQAEQFSVRLQQSFVIIRGPAGMTFHNFDDAERARELLSNLLPNLLSDLVVAFVEINTTP